MNECLQLSLALLMTILFMFQLLYMYKMSNLPVEGEYKQYLFPTQLPGNIYESRIQTAAREVKEKLLIHLYATDSTEELHGKGIDLLQCFNPLTVYYSLSFKKLRSKTTLAFVKDHKIHLNSDFFRLSPKKRAETLLHECTHTMLNAKDYAYKHEKLKFKRLPLEKQMDNADTIVNKII